MHPVGGVGPTGCIGGDWVHRGRLGAPV